MARGRGSSVSGYGLGPAQTPGRALALAALAALTLLARPAEAGGPPQVFYKLRVVTSAGEVVEGQGWIFFVDYLGDRELNAVELEQHANEVLVRGRYAGSDETRERTWSFTPGRAPELELFAGHRRFEHPHGVYYLPRGGRALPLDEIRRIDVVEVIGRGPRIAGDPEVFQSVPEPYLQVDDCGLGCLEKVRSRDPNVTREALEALWAEHFSCETRGNFHPYNLATPQDWGDAQKFALFHEHQLEVLRDPTCLD
jgi:hypothetical protein